MDGTTIEHSDSDSGESWTLLEASPAYADDAPELPENAPEGIPDVGDIVECEKDEDTDGISIISDSDPESSFPCELNVNRCLIDDNRPTEQQSQHFFSVNQLSSNNIDNQGSVKSEDDFLSVNTGKHKTYVHRRNKRLSTVLNIIVLGSVITAAGVAIGHMWGAKNDCAMQSAPSVNKILSNLYKLQEENAYLRSKLKELTLINNIQTQQRKSESEKSKQQKCKKVFEEPLNKNIADKYTKCIEVENNSHKRLDPNFEEPEYEKEFMADIERLKLVYKQNRSWLNEQISQRINHEKRLMKKLKTDLKENNEKLLKDKSQEKTLETISELPNIETNLSERTEFDALNVDTEGMKKYKSERKVSYADSLQSEHKNVEKREVKKFVENTTQDRAYKRKPGKNIEVTSEYSLSEDEFKKDDRYVGRKHKQERKTFDRQKSHKKQKRKNKYEQWEMKGGYMKDYDDFSITSQDLENNMDKNKLNDKVEEITSNKQSETKDNNKFTGIIDMDMSLKNGKSNKKKEKQKDANWYENRVILRMEARKRLQQELFGDTSPNTAGWYFRRMHRREQCRVKNDNSTHKKFLKRNMNFKMKH